MCKGVLNDTCLGAGWLRAVMASRPDTGALSGIFNLMIPSFSDAA